MPVESALLGGQVVPVDAGRLVLDAPVERATDLVVRVAPRAFGVGGAAWDGPVVVRTGTFPGPLTDWRDLGLGAWSGGIRSTRTLQVHDGERLRLDLGRVRGAVEVAVDDVQVAALFCAPFVVDLGDLDPGEHEVTVTVLGTLAPRLDSISPTSFIRTGQLSTGVRGPVRLLREPDASTTTTEAP